MSLHAKPVHNGTTKLGKTRKHHSELPDVGVGRIARVCSFSLALVLVAGVEHHTDPTAATRSSNRENVFNCATHTVILVGIAIKQTALRFMDESSTEWVAVSLRTTQP